MIGLLGLGAWARVYAATRTARCPWCVSCPIEVALKVVPLAGLPPILREAYPTETGPWPPQPVEHPRLVRVFHRFRGTDRLSSTGGPAAVTVMERAEYSVAAALAAGRLPAPELVLRDVCDGLGGLHRAGWLHGNVSAGNVLLMPDGTARLGDLDQARPLIHGVARVPPYGSLDYLPPEWWTTGLDHRGVEAGPALDLWAFGVLSYVLLTGGRHPFPGANATQRALAVRRHGRGRPAPGFADNLPQRWRSPVTDCLCPAPARRAAVNLDDLRRRIDGWMTLTPHRDTSAAIAAMMVDIRPGGPQRAASLVDTAVEGADDGRAAWGSEGASPVAG